jgi:hypothetical protein
MVFVFMKDRLSFAAGLFSGTISPQPSPLLGNLDIATYNGMPKLHFSLEGTFKISVLEDLHFGEGQETAEETTSQSFVLLTVEQLQI